MKLQYKKILIKGQSLWVIVVFLILSLGFWLANKLSENYEATIPVVVHLRGYNSASMILSTDAVRMDVRAFGSGLTLLKYKLTEPQIQIDLGKVYPQMNNSHLYSLPHDQILQIVEYQLKEVQVRDIYPQNVLFTAISIIHKKLPIHLTEWISYKEQFFSSHTSLNPDSVWVSGPSHILDTMSRVNTVLFTAKNLDHDVSEKIKLAFPERVSCNISYVQYINSVERYTQNVVRVPIHLTDSNPLVKVQLIPSYTEISYKVPLKEVRMVRDTMFSLGVNTQDMNDSKSGMVKVRILKSPISEKLIQLKNPYIKFIIFRTQL